MRDYGHTATIPSDTASLGGDMKVYLASVISTARQYELTTYGRDRMPVLHWPSGQRNEITRAAANRFLRRARVNGNVKLERWSY